jgi:hypothetical protein
MQISFCMKSAFSLLTPSQIILPAYLESVPLDKPFVGAASSREINPRGWKPLPHSMPLVLSR